MNKQPTYERRGTMVYEEGTARKGSAKYVAECKTVGDAINIVRRLNELAEIVNSGLGIDDVVETYERSRQRP